jgi:hypothetical protein
MRMSRWVAALACAAAAVAGLTAAPGWTVAAVASVAAPPARPPVQRVVPAGYEPISTSWPTPRSGLVLFGKGIAGAGLPYLFRTGDGGRSWRRVPMPRWLPDSTIAWGDGAIVAVSSTPSQRSADSPAWRIGVTRDGGRRWASLGMPGVLPARQGLIVGLLDLTVADGRVFVVVTRTVYGTGASSAGVYSGRLSGKALRPVAGLSISGGTAYGNISAQGGVVQADLGANFATQRYWYSKPGAGFTAAPLPCAAGLQALTARVAAGQPVALCAGSPSDVAAGQNDKRVRVAPGPGRPFHSAGPVFVSPNEQLFTAATTHTMAVATAFTLAMTFNGGRSWRNELVAGAGARWAYLAFPTPATGFTLYMTVSATGRMEVFLDRTVDGGRVWHPVPLP